MKSRLFAAWLWVAILSALNPESRAAFGLEPLRVAGNQRFLVTAAGRPFFWLGDTAWELFHRLDRAEAEFYLRDRAAKGFNVIQAVALAELEGLTEPNRYGYLPLLDKDPARPAVKAGPANDYWDFVDEVLDLAEANGLYVAFLPTWGKYVTSSAFDGKVDGIFNPTNALNYGQFLGERYRGRSNWICILGGDKAPSTPEAVAIWRAMAKGIAIGVAGREDYNAVLMTYHTSGPGHVSDYIHDEPWLDFTSAQSSHGDLVESWRFIARHWNRQPTKPVIDLESSYPDALIPASWLPAHLRRAHRSNKPSNDDHARRAAYWAVFAGAFGHTYGHNSIWQMYQPPRKPILDAKLTWREALDASSARQMGHLRRLIESRPFLTQSPDQSLLADGEGDGLERVAALRGDGYALIYTPTGKPFRVRLNKLNGPQIKAWWFDPRAGTAAAAGQFPSGGEKEFRPPGTPGVGNDWVLVLDNAAKKWEAPGLKTDPSSQASGGPPAAETPIPWASLKNPILGRDDWAIKDQCIIEKDGWFYLFASAFYPEDGDIRCHIVSFKTRDFLTWSEPLLNFYGREMGLNGFTSPSIHQFGERYILVFGRWSTPRLTSRNPPPKGSAMMFYRESRDLEHWSPLKPLARNLEAYGHSSVYPMFDGALAHANGRFYLIVKFQDGRDGTNRELTRVATSPSLDGEFKLINDGALISLEGRTQSNTENWQFLHVDGKWYLVCDNPASVFEMKDDGSRDEHWLHWHNQRFLLDTPELCETPFIMDRTCKDGYFYLTMARRYGDKRFQPENSWNRTHKNIELYRCRNFQTFDWKPAGTLHEGNDSQGHR